MDSERESERERERESEREKERGTEGGGVIKFLTLHTFLHICYCIQPEVQEICTNIDII